MSGPVHMVFINLVALILLLAGTIIYTSIYPKRKVNLQIMVVLLAALLSISIFRNGTYESGDFNIHLYRTISFFSSLKEGHLLPSWAAQLNQTYGYPLFIFNYPLPYYLISFFHLLGFSFILSMKLFLAGNIIASGIFMYIAMKALFKNDFSAFTASVFYLFVPYHLIDVHFKIVIGEVLFFTLFPLAFYFLIQLPKRKSVHVLLLALIFALLIMSHVVIALFAAVVLGAYGLLLTIENKKYVHSLLLRMIISFGIGSLITLYIWLTPFLLIKYTNYQGVIIPQVLSVPLKELLYSPFRFGLLFQGPKGEISNLIGYTQLAVVLILLYQLIKGRFKPQMKRHLIFWLATFFILIFLITPYADFFWKTIPFLSNVGNHRLLILVAFTTSLLAGYLPLIFPNKQKLILLLLFITVSSTILNWGQRRVIPEINDEYLIKHVPQSTSHGEAHYYASSKWRDKNHLWFSDLPKSDIIIKKGTDEFKTIQKTSTLHTYTVNAKTALQVSESTQYFPGWIVRINNRIVPLTYQEGLINFTIPQGLNFIEVRYEDVFSYRVLKLISMGSLVIVCLSIAILEIPKRIKPLRRFRFSANKQ